MVGTVKAEPAFSTDGFRNWKHALEKFSCHEKSSAHKEAVLHCSLQKQPHISAQLSAQKLADQNTGRECLKTIFSTARFLLRQGLAFRGHSDEEGNFIQLLKLRSQEIPVLRTWMRNHVSYTSPLIQNEIIRMFSDKILNNIVTSIKESKYFSVICDGTQDVSGKEQESLCIRYVDSDLIPQEVFLGMYEPPDTRGETLAKVILDVLLRLGLEYKDIRGQTYDGASNMSGVYNGCQAHIKNKNPLALNFHCGAHCANLATQASSTACPAIRDALSWIQELGVLYSRSTKFKNICASAQDSSTPRVIRPMCPTRWLCRVPAIRSVLAQYSVVLHSLEEMSTASGPTGTKARGLKEQLSKGSVALYLIIAEKVLSPLEELNKVTQSRNVQMRAMLDTVENTIGYVKSLRTDEHFVQLVRLAEEKIDEIELLLPVTVPRHANVNAQSKASVSDFFRPQYFAVIDHVISSLENRFSRNSESLSTYIKLEEVLLTGKVDDALKQFPEFDIHSLRIQLDMFKLKYECCTMDEVLKVFQKFSSEIKTLFSEVESLVRLLLVMPVSSCESERSFSALRRLKTWLRSSMTQVRTNAVCIGHIHKNILDDIDITGLIEQFIKREEKRRLTFG